MSQKDSGDAVRVPIEIKTEDIQELQELIRQINEADEDATRLKSTGITRGRESQTFAGQARAAGGERVTTEGRGGIFEDRLPQGPSLPQRARDAKSSQAMQRENQFKEMQKDMQNMEEMSASQAAVVGQIANMVGMGGLIPSMLGTPGGVKAGWKAKAGSKFAAGKAPAGMGMAGAAGGMFGKLSGMVGKLGGIGFMVSMVFDIVMQVFDWALGPGGPLDRRFKRMVTEEVASATDRETKHEIRQGIRFIHMSPYPTYRGAATAQAALLYEEGTPAIEFDLEYRSKDA
jgi:hypothetical protein